jgi:hypothetical protein
MTRARELAEWIGDMRELTSTGVLRPAAAVEACRALGIELPSGKPRSAKDVPELKQAWEVAVAGELVLVTANRARAARDVAELGQVADGTLPAGQDLAERVLLAWVRGAGVPLGFPGDACPYCLAALHELSLVDKPMELADLMAAVRAATDGPVPGLDPGVDSGPDPGQDLKECPDCGEVHELPGLAGLGGALEERAAEHAVTAARSLAHFGALATRPGRTPGGSVVLTGLGRLLADSVIASLTPPATASAGTLVSAMLPLAPSVARAATAPWLAARAPAGAVSELLAYAEGADPDLRFTALQIAREQGSAGNQAWREYAKEPGFGAHARQWLAAQAEPVTEDDRDEPWLLVETIVHAEDGALPSGLAPFLFAGAIGQMVADGADIEAVLAGIRGCGHPRAEQVAGALSAAVNTLASPWGGLIGPGGLVVAFDDDDDDDIEDGALFQLKITLRGVSKPPVWRRVLVPAAITLDELHEVILGVMGWIGGHLHVFDDHFTEYGVPGDELGFEDEADVALAGLMTEPGDRVVYTYDFGDDWTHDIKLEKVLPPDPAARVPVCLAGKGACPPEDCGGAWAYAELKEEADGPDPAAFSIDAANARLRRISVAAHSVRTSADRDRSG